MTFIMKLFIIPLNSKNDYPPLFRNNGNIRSILEKRGTFFDDVFPLNERVILSSHLLSQFPCHVEKDINSIQIGYP